MEMRKIACWMAALALLCFAGAALSEESELVRIKQQETVLTVGGSENLTLTYDRSVKKGGAVTVWTTGDEAVAVVSDRGSLRGVAPGKTDVSCEITLKNGTVLHAGTVVEVVQPVETLTLTPEKELTVGFGTQTQLTAAAAPEDASNPGVVWGTSDESVAVVDQNGVLHALKAGRTRVKAEAADGYGASAALEVTVTSVYAETEEVVLDNQEEKSVRVYFEGRTPQEENGENWDFEADYQVIQEGNGFTWTVETEGNTAAFTLKPREAGAENQLIIRDRRNGQFQANVRIEVTEDAICDAQKLPVESARLVSGAGSLTYQFEITNHSGQEIGEIGFLVDYRDQFGDPYYLFSNSDGTIQNYSYTARVKIKPGDTVPLTGRTDGFRSDDLIEEVRLAINYYRYIDSGEKVYIPDSQLFWFSTKSGELPRPEHPVKYIQPDEDTTDLADQISYNLRATTCDLYSYVVKRFSRSRHAGKYVAAVGDDGWAQRWGLMPKDVIYGADDMLWTDDPFFLNRAFAKICGGETATLKVVRNGREIEIPISESYDDPEEETENDSEGS